MDTYIVYFDETGDDGNTTKSSSEFVLTSIYMPTEKWKENHDIFTSFRREMKTKYGLRTFEEMHTMDFLRDRNPYRNYGWTLDQRREILIAFAHCISQLSIKVVTTIIDKTKIRRDDYKILETALTYNIQRIENDSNGNWNYIIISDKGRISEMRDTARKIKSVNYIPSRTGISSNTPIKNLIEDVMEKDSKDSYFIQICDYLSCFAFMFYRNVVKKCKIPGRIAFLIDKEFITFIINIFKEGNILNTNAARYNEYGFVIYPRA